MKTLEEHIDKITLCSDGEYRKLKKFDEDYLYYAVPISETAWMSLSGTYRGYVEHKFLNGKIVEYIEVEK